MLLELSLTRAWFVCLAPNFSWFAVLFSCESARCKMSTCRADHNCHFSGCFPLPPSSQASSLSWSLAGVLP